MDICRKLRRQTFRCVFGLMALFIAPTTLWFDALAEDVSPPNTRTGVQSTSPQPTANKDVHRLQRLLKLLANQNPARFSSVDPGIPDGKVGRGTITAIRNFQRITGNPETGAITNELFRQILKAQSERPASTEIPPQPATSKSTALPDQKISGNGNPAPPQRFAQLGSIKDESQIGDEWTRLQQANPKHLSGWTPIIEIANLAERGTYYRILVGPFETFERAKMFCNELRKQRQSCLVKKGTGARHSTNLRPKKNPTPVPAIPTPIASPKPEEKSDANSIKKSGVPHTANKNAPALPSDPVGNKDSDIPTESSTPVEAVVETSLPQTTSAAPNESAPNMRAAPTNPKGNIGSGSATSTFVETADMNKPVKPLPKLATNSPPTGSTVSDASSAKTDGTDRSNPSKAKPLSNTQPVTALAQWQVRADSHSHQSYLGPTFAAVAGTVIGILVLVWWQHRQRNLAFDAILGSPIFDDQGQHNSIRKKSEHFESSPQEEERPKNPLEELQTQFDADDLVESRRVRDTFLKSITELNDAVTNAYSGEHAMLVNRKLNQLISSDPDTYKAIFLNWVFLNHVADEISTAELTMKRLDPRIQAEFQLLASLFKIHLLELEARHHVRQRLPNLFSALNDF